ncbi:hypothetical protein IFM46972_08169 [Aspergillus udagawae]|uniref:Uncharacterized protein n=1 Tax=Aspergillus udagawae TaxID=91492 RepID=A0A8H3P6K1_9EURO|nr:hypothetical protein IFM46972_08169 [Aspergillus udagawae]
MAGLTVKSAGGSFVGDPKLRDEIAVIALIRVFKAELPVATGLDLQEIWKAALESELSGGYDTDCRDKLKDCMRQEFTDQGVDLSILEEIMMSLDKLECADSRLRIHDVGVNPAEMSEDDIKHLFGDYDHDGVDLLPPPPPTPESPPPASPPVSRPASPPPSSPPSSSPPDKKDDDGSDYISRWRQYIIAVQDQLYLLEPEVGGAIEESTAQALEAIANGLARLNQLLEFWPDYKGDDATNKQRLAIIQSATDLVGNGKQDVKDTDEDTSVLNKVLALEEKLNGLRTQFRDETTAEQAELDKIKPELQTAVEKMFADQKLYQSAQGKLLANIKEISDAELKHDPGATIKGGVEWYKDLLRRRTSAREETQSIADAADATYLQSEEIVVSIQARQAELNHIHKRRFSVEREITKAEMIIDDLKIMINGTKQQEDRVLSMVDLLSSTLDDLTHVGEPPYHRHDRKIADQMCTTVLKVHRESLVDPSFVDSAREAVTAVQNWFDDYMPKSVQEEIDAIVNNSLYQPSTNDDAKGDDEMELDEEQGPLVGYN